MAQPVILKLVINPLFYGFMMDGEHACKSCFKANNKKCEFLAGVKNTAILILTDTP